MRCQLAIVTLDGRAYYRATSLLKELGLSHASFSPGQEPPEGLVLAITTERERPLVKAERVLTVEALGRDHCTSKQRLLRELLGGINHRLVVGIDPGRRTGIAAFYQEFEVEHLTLSSTKRVLDEVIALVESSPAEKRLVRIGGGDPAYSPRLAFEMSNRLRDKAVVELVDEKGTSGHFRGSRRVSTRDWGSAALIAFRKGRKVC